MRDGEDSLSLTDSLDSLAEEFGPYLVYERLGMGGMATVHRAKKRGIAGFERGVALKRMLPHLSEDASFIASFVHEAKLVSLLVHPNIAQIYDFGRIDNVYFIAMEHVHGLDVNRLLRYSHRHNTLLPINFVLSILCELCEALEYAHTFVDENGQPQGIVHRDVSPSNLIVAQTGHLKVIDFGIAKGSCRSPHTESGQVKGKLGYMSPEAVEARPIGPPSDVFSAGIVAHELLTARRLFSASTDYETMRRIREAEIPPPSCRNPRVPASLDRAVLAALERDDRRRLQSASAFRKALEQVAIEAGIRFSSSDVAAWWAKVATMGSRTSPPSTSSSAAMRRFAQPVSPGSLPRMYPSPYVERSESQHAAHPPDVRSRVLLAESLAEHLDGASFAESDAQPAVSSGCENRLPSELPSRVSAPSLSPPTAPPRSRPRTRAGIAVGGLCMIAAGLAVYQFAVHPTAALAPPSSAPPPSPPGPAVVKFIVRPPDSTVEIGGKEVARYSPFEIQLERGVYSVAVSRAGYKRWTTQIALHDPERQTVNVALEPATAIVRVSSLPSGLVAQLDGEALDQVTPAEFKTSPGPHRLVVVGAASTWAQDFVATTDGTHAFHAVLAPARRAPVATSSGVARTTPQAPERTPSRPSSSSAMRTPAAREPGIEPEDRVIDFGAEFPVGKPLPTLEPLPGPAAQPNPTVTLPPALPQPVSPMSAPPLIPASTVTKLSGEIPAIQSDSGSADVYSKICIGIDGHVTSVKIIRASPGIASELQRSLLRWRYKPYVDDAGHRSPACFAVSFRLVFERAH